MSHKKQNRIYFISGVSGVGKTSTLKHLKELLPKSHWDIRDLDERGVPDGGGLEWLNNETRHWLDVAKNNAENGKSTIVCGFANPELFNKIYKPDEDIPAQLILLHASGDILKKRLLGRHSTADSIREIERAAGVSIDAFIENNTSFAPSFRKIFEQGGYPIIDTDDKTPKEIAEGIVRIIENKAYVSILVTDDYLPGLLVLSASLKFVKSRYPLHVLLTPNISEKTIDILIKNSITYSILSQNIDNPTNINIHHRWFPTYSKLAIFDQVQYEKIVYLDVDMMVLRNIDELFECPHMSATNAGSMLPRKKDRKHLNLNSGLIVIEPSHYLFNDMMSKVGKIENLESGGSEDKPAHGSDQDFINAYFPEWPNQKNLHLDHKYNLFHYHLDEYNKLFGYTIENSPKPISVIHYASYLKPWNIKKDEIDNMANDPNRRLELKAIQLWVEVFYKIKR